MNLFSGTMLRARRNMRMAFTLIELLVVIAIFSLISIMILANHSKFNSSVLLGSLAYNIALSVRQAQVYGLSVQTYNSGFDIGYGVHFGSADNTHFIFFADANASQNYDNPPDSPVSTYSVGQGHTVKTFCGVLASGGEECSDTGLINTLDIVFYRPDPDAHFTTNRPGPYQSAYVVVTSPSGETRRVTVYSTGQISVSNP